MNSIKIEIVSLLNASFFQKNGSSKPGTDWAVTLTQMSIEYKILVRSYDDDFVGLAMVQKIQNIIQYVSRLLDSGWNPKDYKCIPGELTFNTKDKP